MSPKLVTSAIDSIFLIPELKDLAVHMVMLHQNPTHCSEGREGGYFAGSLVKGIKESTYLLEKNGRYHLIAFND